jgi:hypothetical protein
MDTKVHNGHDGKPGFEKKRMNRINSKTPDLQKDYPGRDFSAKKPMSTTTDTKNTMESQDSKQAV